MKRIAAEDLGFPLPEVKINVIPPILMVLPFAFAILALAAYLVKYVLPG